MKNQKNAKTILGFILIVSIVVSTIIALMNMIEWPWFYYFSEVEGGNVIAIDWIYGGILIGLLFFAFVIFAVRTCLFTSKSESTPIKIMEGCIGLGLIIAIIAFFLPMNAFIAESGSEEANILAAYANPCVAAGMIMAWIGTPLALASSIGVAFMNRRQHVAAA